MVRKCVTVCVCECVGGCTLQQDERENETKTGTYLNVPGCVQSVCVCAMWVCDGVCVCVHY